MGDLEVTKRKQAPGKIDGAVGVQTEHWMLQASESK